MSGAPERLIPVSHPTQSTRKKKTRGGEGVCIISLYSNIRSELEGKNWGEKESSSKRQLGCFLFLPERKEVN